MVILRAKELRKRHLCAGVDKMQRMLANPDYGLPISIGRDRLGELLKRYNMQSKLYKRYKVTTNSKHRFLVHPNLVKDLVVDKINAVWVSDITYISLPKGKFCYLFLVTDLYSRRILGWALKESLASEGAEEAFLMAAKLAKPKLVTVPLKTAPVSDGLFTLTCPQYKLTLVRSLSSVNLY